LNKFSSPEEIEKTFAENSKVKSDPDLKDIRKEINDEIDQEKISAEALDDIGYTAI